MQRTNWRVFAAALVTVLATSCAANHRGRDTRPAHLPSQQVTVNDGRSLFADEATLSANALVAAVLLRNRTIESARKGWQAAASRPSQTESLDDPQISYSLAPLSVVSSRVDFGQVIEISQALPFPGKRGLRGKIANAEAREAEQDFRTLRLRIAMQAVHLYYRLYTVLRFIEIYEEFERELQEHRETLTAHMAAGHAWQDDALKVDVDLGEVSQAQIDFDTQRDLLVAQINELLHRAPELALPPLPSALELPESVSESSIALQAEALTLRPELRAARARSSRQSAGLELADRDFYPDFRVMGRYNSMWATIEHELMLGVSMTVPLWRERRRAAVDEAEALLDQSGADYSAAETRIRTEVDRSYRAQQSALLILGKYRNSIVPAAKDRVQAIRAGLDSGRTSFIEVLRADHDLLTIELRYEKALANAHSRQADLRLATGRLIADTTTGNHHE